MIKAVAYYRKSTSGFDENGNVRQEGSHDRQRRAVKECAVRNNLEIVREIEESKSGKTIRKREKFLQLIEEARNPETRSFDAIIFDDPSRFMRNVRLAREYQLLFHKVNLKIYFANLSNDKSFGDDITFDLLIRMADMFSRDHARKVLGGTLRKAQMHSWLGGTPPYGYRSEHGADNIVRLVIKEDEAKVVREIFERSLKGQGHKTIAVCLNEREIPAGWAARGRTGRNRNKDGKWAGDGIRVILRNPAYKGTYRWNKMGRVDSFDWSFAEKKSLMVGELNSEKDLFKKDKKPSLKIGDIPKVFVNRLKDKSEWFEKDDVFPPIVSKEVFDKAQERFKKFFHKKGIMAKTQKSLMGGYLQCDTCGNSLFAHHQPKRLKNGTLARYPYYRCAGDIRKGSHGDSSRPTIRRPPIDDIVLDGILRRVSAVADLTNVRELFKNRLKSFLNSRPERIIQVEKDIQKLTAKKERILYVFKEYGDPINENEMAELNRQITALEHEREALKRSGNGRLNFDIETEADKAMKKAAQIKSLLEAKNGTNAVEVRDDFLESARIKWSTTNKRPVLELDWFEVPRFVGRSFPIDDLSPAPRFYIKQRSQIGSLKNKKGRFIRPFFYICAKKRT